MSRNKKDKRKFSASSNKDTKVKMIKGGCWPSQKKEDNKEDKVNGKEASSKKDQESPEGQDDPGMMLSATSSCWHGSTAATAKDGEAQTVMRGGLQVANSCNNFLKTVVMIISFLTKINWDLMTSKIGENYLATWGPATAALTCQGGGEVHEGNSCDELTSQI